MQYSTSTPPFISTGDYSTAINNAFSSQQDAQIAERLIDILQKDVRTKKIHWFNKMKRKLACDPKTLHRILSVLTKHKIIASYYTKKAGYRLVRFIFLKPYKKFFKPIITSFIQKLKTYRKYSYLIGRFLERKAATIFSGVLEGKAVDVSIYPKPKNLPFKCTLKTPCVLRGDPHLRFSNQPATVEFLCSRCIFNRSRETKTDIEDTLPIQIECKNRVEPVALSEFSEQYDRHYTEGKTWLIATKLTQPLKKFCKRKRIRPITPKMTVPSDLHLKIKLQEVKNLKKTKHGRAALATSAFARELRLSRQFDLIPDPHRQAGISSGLRRYEPDSKEIIDPFDAVILHQYFCKGEGLKKAAFSVLESHRRIRNCPICKTLLPPFK